MIFLQEWLVSVVGPSSGGLIRQPMRPQLLGQTSSANGETLARSRFKIDEGKDGTTRCYFIGLKLKHHALQGGSNEI